MNVMAGAEHFDNTRYVAMLEEIARRNPRPPSNDGEIVAREGGAWHVILTEPNRESTVAAGLVGRGIEHFNPTKRVWLRVNSHRRRVAQKPLFPGYLFAALPRVFGRVHERVRGLAGVGGFLMQRSERAAVLSPEDWKLIKAAGIASMGMEPVMDIQVGSSVEIMGGAFSHWIGRVHELDDRGRIGVLLSIFGRETLVNVPALDVVKVD